MKIFFDLDDVLFNTGAFVNAQADIFVKQGVDADIFHATYSQARLIGDDVVKVYSFVDHIEILRRYVPGLDKEVLCAQYEELFKDTRQYVFADAIPFLNDMKQKGANIFVVSFGIEKVQRAKIEGSGLMMIVDDFFVGAKKKSLMIESVLDGDVDAWFIDDQPKFVDDVKTVFPFIKTIQMMRKDGRFINARTENSDFVAENMQEVSDLINHNV